MGFFTAMMTNGSHLTPIVGGLLGQYCKLEMYNCTNLIENREQLIMSVGTFKFAAILDAVMLVTVILSPRNSLRSQWVHLQYRGNGVRSAIEKDVR